MYLRQFSVYSISEHVSGVGLAHLCARRHYAHTYSVMSGSPTTTATPTSRYSCLSHDRAHVARTHARVPSPASTHACPNATNTANRQSHTNASVGERTRSSSRATQTLESTACKVYMGFARVCVRSLCMHGTTTTTTTTITLTLAQVYVCTRQRCACVRSRAEHSRASERCLAVLWCDRNSSLQEVAARVRRRSRPGEVRNARVNTAHTYTTSCARSPCSPSTNHTRTFAQRIFAHSRVRVRVQIVKVSFLLCGPGV